MDITFFFPFWRAILSCFPAPILAFFLSILGIYIVIIFTRLIISFLG